MGPVRAFMELVVALKGTISVALRRARPATVVVGGLAVVLVLAGVALALGAWGADGSDDMADGGGDRRGDVTTGSGEQDATDPGAVGPDGRPLVDGVATRSTTGTDDGAASEAGAAEGGPAPTDGGRAAAGAATGGSTASSTTRPPVSTPPGSTSTTATVPGSSTTTEEPTTTTTAPGASSGGGVLGGLLELLGLG